MTGTIITINRKKFDNSAITPFFCPGIKQTTTLLFSLKVLWCSKLLMQQMTSITTSIYEFIFLKHFNHFPGFRPFYVVPGPFSAIPSVCFRGPCTSKGCVQLFDTWYEIGCKVYRKQRCCTSLKKTKKTGESNMH